MSRPPNAISVGELIRSLDGPVALVPCVEPPGEFPCEECVDDRVCGMRTVMDEVQHATSTILDRTSLADLLARSEIRNSHPESGTT